MGTNAGKREQTRGSVPEFVYEMGQKGNKRGEKGTNVGAPYLLGVQEGALAAQS